MNTNKHELLFKELSYQLQGAAIEVRKNFGPGLKESLYQNAFAEELESRSIKFEKEKAIKIYSPKTGKYIGLYRPDFVVEDKIIVEIKAVSTIPKMFLEQIYDYLRNSKYELGYFINFTAPRLYVKRIIYTNDRKPFLAKTLVAISLIFVLFSVCSRTQAAVLYSAAANQDVYEGQAFVVDWFLDTEKSSINTVSLKLFFSADYLQVSDITAGNSLLNLWVQSPSADNQTGKISLIGGVINGINSAQVPLFRTTFYPKKPGLAYIKFDPNSQVLLNDGRGTTSILKFKDELFNIYPANFLPVKISSPTHPDPEHWYQDHDVKISFEPKTGVDYSYSFSSNIELIPDNQKQDIPNPIVFSGRPDGVYYFKLNSKKGQGNWQEAGVFRVQIDSTPPEDFLPEIGSDPNIFGGRKFISFSTVDKTSGILHYKVKFGWLSGLKTSQNNYVLIPKFFLGNKIKISALDHAGNIRQVSVAYNGIPPWLVDVSGLAIFSAMIGIVWVIIKKLKKRKFNLK